MRFVRQGIFGKSDHEFRLPATAAEQSKQHERGSQAGRSSPPEAQPSVDGSAQLPRSELSTVAVRGLAKLLDEFRKRAAMNGETDLCVSRPDLDRKS